MALESDSIDGYSCGCHMEANLDYHESRSVVYARIRLSWNVKRLLHCVSSQPLRLGVARSIVAGSIVASTLADQGCALFRDGCSSGSRGIAFPFVPRRGVSNCGCLRCDRGGAGNCGLALLREAATGYRGINAAYRTEPEGG